MCTGSEVPGLLQDLTPDLIMNLCQNPNGSNVASDYFLIFNEFIKERLQPKRKQANKICKLTEQC